MGPGAPHALVLLAAQQILGAGSFRTLGIPDAGLGTSREGHGARAVEVAEAQGGGGGGDCIDCPEYVALTAAEKQQRLWRRLTADEYRELPRDFPDLFAVNFRDLRRVAWNGTMSAAFDRFSDENPMQHAKVIHTFGAVAMARFTPVANNLGLTGLFRGAEHTVLRLSIVADWTKPCKGGTDLNFKGCFKPSMALKFLRDGDFSSNLVAQPNLGDGVGQDFNFFHHAQGTWLPMPWGLGAEIVKYLFSYASDKNQINGVGLEEISSGGSRENEGPRDISAPRMLYILPHASVRERFESAEHDVREDFKLLATGTVLYDVVTPTDPDAWLKRYRGPPPPEDIMSGKCPYTIVGRIVTTSRFVASAYGDRRLFFQHERLGKGGPWKRQSCALDTDAVLADTAEYRMASQPGHTCTQHCLYGTKPVPGACPFEKLAER